ncbi:MAG: hypothetical protein HQL69_05495 [Magnetococcales bacterium]|nr:hypothetical protein [Magnetococcales bacterium]
MNIAAVSESMNQVISFMSNQASQGLQNASSNSEPQTPTSNEKIVRENNIIHGGNSDAFKVSFSSAALSKNSIIANS